MKNILLWVWQFPQNIVGFILVKAFQATKTTDKSSGIVYWKFERRGRFSRYMSGVSLGMYILLADNDDGETVRHEHGHQIQSLYLGFLYLLIIGAPSAIGNVVNRNRIGKISEEDRISRYYHQPWEWWADELGRVNRPWKKRRQRL